MKLALVIPWFGRELKGGAEQQAWQFAVRLAARDHAVEVLTTCCRSHQDDWSSNHWPAGLTSEGEGFAVRRFPVVSRDERAFAAVARSLQSFPPETLQPGVAPVAAEESRIFVEELIKSPDFLDFLRAHRAGYDWFLFLPYLYGPVIDGIGIVGHRAALQPCLHDEAYAYLPEVAAAVRHAALLLFNSEGEQELALRLFGPGIWPKCRLIGGGVECEPARETAQNTDEVTRERFVLYLGRKDAGKNVPLLLSAFARFRRVRPNSNLHLLLAGHGEAGVNSAIPAQDLGLVSEATKASLLRDCVALFQPSRNESLSRVLLEAWLHGKPVAAHGACLATAVAVRRAQGGWLAESEEDWARLFIKVDRAPEQDLRRLGESGRRYAAEMADWGKVIERCESALLGDRPNKSSPALPHAGEIDQYLPNLSYGDAISNHALWIREQLRAFGYRSEIYARAIDPELVAEGRPFSAADRSQPNAVIYHHSIGSEITPHVLRFPGAKCLIYHNITPAEFFEPFWPQYAELIRRGRADLAQLAPHFPFAYGVSAYNARELDDSGFDSPGVLPIAVDPARWDFEADPELLRFLQDGRTNLLFVGRIAPNKKQDELVAAFARYLRLDPEARLILVGLAEQNDRYPLHVENTIRELGLEDSVINAGRVEDAQLSAYWRSADLFWSMSEHEGFCVPLVEAMWFDVPIIAFGSSAISETLGDAGLIFTDKTDLDQVAALAHLAVNDMELRGRMIEAQRRQRLRFLPDTVTPILASLAAQLVP